MTGPFLEQKLSVLMPAYNAEPFLAAAIESILSQTLKDFEFLILDDGSKDQSLAVARRYEAQDRRVKVIARENRGLIKSRNELLEAASCDIVAWADADDVSYQRRLAAQFSCFDDSTVVWTSARIRLVDEYLRPIRLVDPSGDPGFLGVAMMRRKIALSLGGLREPLRICEDRDLALRMAEVGTIVNLQEVLLDYRQHATSACNTERGAVNAYRELVDALARDRRATGSDAIQRGEPLPIAISDGQRSPESTDQTYSRWAWCALLSGYRKTALRYATKVAIRKPLSLESWRLLACAARGH